MKLNTLLILSLLSCAAYASSDLTKEVNQKITRNLEEVQTGQFRADGAGNGGDSCESRIKVIRNDIESWILNGGASSIILPQTMSYEDYKERMLRALTGSFPIICLKDSVIVAGAEKTCKNYEDSNRVIKVECDLNRFMSLNEEDQYRLIHHEYAGIAGLEENTGIESKYFLSKQIAAYLENQIVKRLAVKKRANLEIELVTLSKGEFYMGSPDYEKGRNHNENYVRKFITKDFEIMSTEVTQELYVKVAGVNPSYFKREVDCPRTFKVVETELGGIDSLCPNHPVENLTLEEVYKFINLLNKRTGQKFRLPTEKEWEYAAKAGRQTAYSFGNNPDFLESFAVYKENSSKSTLEVGSKRSSYNRANRNGLYDMHGNVWEWTSEQPYGLGTSVYVIKGGSWDDSWKDLRSASRFFHESHKADNRLGFRLVRTL